VVSEPPEQPLRIEVPGAGLITALKTPPEGEPTEWTFVYAPGAGSNVHDPFGTFACRELAGRGVRAVIEQLQSQADPPPRMTPQRTVVGGRSMGGRIGSQVVAQGIEADALALFAYPLHPPGRPERRRDERLSAIGIPTLFCSGDSDAFATPEELAEAATLVPNARVHLLEGADHGFATRKASGRSRDDVWREAVDAVWQWLASL
jgi:predicted alpha/beta-hydrolase family hydrolase